MPPDYRPTRAEQETTIRFDREACTAHIWSASPVIWRKFARLGVAPVRTATVRGVESGRFYVVPLDRLRWSIRPAERRQRTGNPAALARARRQRTVESTPEAR